MIAAAGTYQYLDGHFADLTLNADPNYEMNQRVERSMWKINRNCAEKLSAPIGNSFQESGIERASARICYRLIQLPAFRHAKTILFYMAIKNEVDVSQAMRGNVAGRKAGCSSTSEWIDMDRSGK